MRRKLVVPSFLFVVLLGFAPVAQAVGGCFGPLFDSRALGGFCALSGSVCYDCWNPSGSGPGYINCSWDFDGSNSCGGPQPYPFPLLVRFDPGEGDFKVSPRIPIPDSQWSREAMELARVANDPTAGTLAVGGEMAVASPVLTHCSDQLLFDRIASARRESGPTVKNGALR